MVFLDNIFIFWYNKINNLKKCRGVIVLGKSENEKDLKSAAMVQFLRQLWDSKGKREGLVLHGERETFDLTIDLIPSLLEKLYKYQTQVIVRIEGTVVLGMFEAWDLQELFVKNNYSEVTLVVKSYGYELEVPTSIER